MFFKLEQRNKHTRKKEVYAGGGARSANEEKLSVNGQLGSARAQCSNRMGTGLRETGGVEGVLSNVDHRQATHTQSSRDGLTAERDTLQPYAAPDSSRLTSERRQTWKSSAVEKVGNNRKARANPLIRTT